MRGLRCNSARERLHKWLRQEQGSFTLESTLIFPMLMGLILLFIIFGMYMYQKVVLYYAASITAERAAFSWDNSHRDPSTSMLSNVAYDSLYWRIGEDEMLSSLFGLAGDNAEATVALPLDHSIAGSEAKLSERKMQQAGQWLGQAGLAYEGQISYSRGILLRKLEVKLKQPLSVEPVEQSWLKREPKTVSATTIVDPVEFIRSVDLVRYYSLKFGNGGGGANQAYTHAGEILAPYKGTGNTRN